MCQAHSPATPSTSCETQRPLCQITFLPHLHLARHLIDPALRDQFEEQGRAVQRLRHVNIAKVFDFGRERENYVYVSERLPGETLAAWVAQHGPMPADATLRVAEQIVSVLSSASFHKLPYPPVEPAYIIVVPGQTPEGGWPLVKLTNFGLAGLKSEAEGPATVASLVVERGLAERIMLDVENPEALEEIARVV